MPDYAAAHVHSLYALDRVLRHRGGRPKRRRFCEKRWLFNPLAEQFPKANAYILWKAILQESLAKMLSDRGRTQEARELLESAVAALNPLLQSEPQAAYIQGMLGRCYRNLSAVLSQMGEKQQAAEMLRKRKRAPPRAIAFREMTTKGSPMKHRTMKAVPQPSTLTQGVFFPSLLAALLLLAGAAASASEGTLWYDKPATKWEQEALPIGNGRLGAMMLRRNAEEHIQFNEERLWIGDEDDTGATRRSATFSLSWSTADGTQYRRELDISRGVHTVTYDSGGVHYRREIFCQLSRQGDGAAIYRRQARGAYRHGAH